MSASGIRSPRSCIFLLGRLNHNPAVCWSAPPMLTSVTSTPCSPATRVTSRSISKYLSVRARLSAWNRIKCSQGSRVR
eukprot:3487286-Prymnesium_polylepis.1